MLIHQIAKEKSYVAQTPTSHGDPGSPSIRVQIPQPFARLFQPARYKIFYGGRDGAKSWAFADALLIQAARQPLRILCTRELQSSIADSVKKVLDDHIVRLGLEEFYVSQKNTITSTCGSEFLFKGLRHNVMEIKSTEGVDICWVEEAQMVSDDSWQVLIPTIRRPGSEIWISFNPGEEEDPTYQRFVVNTPPDSIIRKINYDENPFHSEVMEKERVYLLKVDPEAYDHVWLGNPKKISDACVFKGKFRQDIFETPEDAHLLFGSDFGFSEDPATLIRFFIQGRKLFIDYEFYEVGVDLDDLPERYDRIPGSRKWTIKGDSARPETISYLKKKASTSNPATNGRAASRTVSPSFASLKRLLSILAANTPMKNSGSIPGRSTNRPERSCPWSSMPITTVLTPSVMAWQTRSRLNPMPDFRSA